MPASFVSQAAFRTAVGSLLIVTLTLTSFVLAQQDEVSKSCVNVEDDAECSRRVSEGQCQINREWMIDNCRLACQACNESDSMEAPSEAGEQDTGGPAGAPIGSSTERNTSQGSPPTEPQPLTPSTNTGTDGPVAESYTSAPGAAKPTEDPVEETGEEHRGDPSTVPSMSTVASEIKDTATVKTDGVRRETTMNPATSGAKLEATRDPIEDTQEEHRSEPSIMDRVSTAAPEDNPTLPDRSVGATGKTTVRPYTTAQEAGNSTEEPRADERGEHSTAASASAGPAGSDAQDGVTYRSEAARVTTTALPAVPEAQPTIKGPEESDRGEASNTAAVSMAAGSATVSQAPPGDDEGKEKDEKDKDGEKSKEKTTVLPATREKDKNTKKIKDKTTLRPSTSEDQSTGRREERTTLPPVISEDKSTTKREAKTTLPPMTIEDKITEKMEGRTTLPPAISEDKSTEKITEKTTLSPVTSEDKITEKREERTTLPPPTSKRSTMGPRSSGAEVQLTTQLVEDLDREGQEHQSNTTVNSTDCVDSDSVQCNKWKEEGECESNPGWMVRNCRLACQACEELGCVNRHKDYDCHFWAADDECPKHPELLYYYCRQGCGRCLYPLVPQPLNENGTVMTIGGISVNGSDADEALGPGSQDTTTSEPETAVLTTPRRDPALTSQSGEVVEESKSESSITVLPPWTAAERIPEATSVGGRKDTAPTTASWITRHGGATSKTLTEKESKSEIPPTEVTREDVPSSKLTTRMTGSPSEKACTNHHDDRNNVTECDAMATKGECNTNANWMLQNCRLACDACVTATTVPAYDCKNGFGDDSQCDEWARNGECERNPAWMTENCEKSCDLCPLDGTRTRRTTTPPTTTPPACLDSEAACKAWSESGECAKNPEWMAANCMVSCKTCLAGTSPSRSSESSTKSGPTSSILTMSSSPAGLSSTSRLSWPTFSTTPMASQPTTSSMMPALSTSTTTAAPVEEPQIWLPPSIPSLANITDRTVYYRRELFDQIKISCLATGHPQPEYMWYKDGKVMDTAHLPSIRWAGAAGDGTIALSPDTLKYTGKYQCEARNAFGTAVSDVVYVKEAFIVSTGRLSLENVYVEEGQPLVLRCHPSAISAPPARRYWLYKDTQTPIQLGAGMSINDNDDLFFSSVSTSASYTERVLLCVAYNEMMQSQIYVTSVIVHITPVEPVYTSPELVYKTNQYSRVLYGGELKLTCIYSGRPNPAVEWFRPGNDDVDWQTSGTQHSLRGGSLVIHNVQFEDAGAYGCRVTTSLNATNLTEIFNVKVEASPRFLVQTDRLRDVNATVGQNVTFRCSALGLPAPMVKWYINNQLIRDFTGYQLSDNGASLSFPSVCKNCPDGSTDLKVIQCNVSNIHGYAFGQGYLNILEETRIVTPLRNVELDVSSLSTLTLYCDVTTDPSTPATVTWIFNGLTLTPEDATDRGDMLILGSERPGRLFSRLEIAVNTSHQMSAKMGHYTCRAGNSYTSDQTQTTVYLSTDVRLPPSFVEQPDETDAYYEMGVEFTLPCKAIGSPTPTVTYYMDGNLTDPEGSNFLKLDADSGRLTIVYSEELAILRPTFECRAENVYGSAMSKRLRLNRAFANSFPITPRPSVMVQEWQPVTLTCFAPQSEPRPATTFVWYYYHEEGRPIKPVELDSRVQVDFSGNLHFAYVERSDIETSDLFTCQIINNMASVVRLSQPTQLNITEGDELVEQLYPAEIRPGYPQQSTGEQVNLLDQALSIQCLAIGKPAPTIVWSKDGQPLSLPPGGRVSADGPATIAIDHLQVDDQGVYSCTAENAVGTSATRSLNITVKAAPQLTEAATALRDVNVTTGDSVTFTCDLMADPRAEVKWFINAKEYTASTTNQKVNVSGNQMIITNVCKMCPDLTSDLMVVGCQAENIYGRLWAEGYINVLLPTRMISAPKDVTVVTSQNQVTSVLFDCEAISDPSTPVSYHWFNAQGQPALVEGLVWEEDFGRQLKVLTLSAEDLISVEGRYTCLATNGYTEDRATASLTAVILPEIPVQPVLMEAKLNDESPLAVDVTWAQSAVDAREASLQFVVEFRGISSDGVEEDWMQASQVDGHVRTYTVVGLIPTLSYQFRVFAKNKLGEGEPSEPSATIRIPDQPPSAAPKGVIGTGEGYTSIVVAWQPPPVEDHNGELQGYLIRYKITVFPEVTTSYRNVTSAATFIYTLRDLIVFTEYELSVAAYNLAGVGPYSQPIQARTREGFPTVPPSQLRAIDITTTTIEISWHPPHPQFINGKLLGHRVTIGETQSGGSSPVMTYVIAIDPDNSMGSQSYIASGLRSGVEYSIQVLAFTSAGEGPSTGISVRTQGTSTLPPETTVNVTGTTPAPVNVTGTTTAPTKVTTIEAVNITSTTPAPVNITGTTTAPVNITSTTTEAVNVTTIEAVNVTSTTIAPVKVTSKTTAAITPKPDLVTGITEEPDLVTGTTEEPDLVTGTTEEPDLVTGTTEEPDLVTGITKEPDLVTGTTEEPDLVTGITEEPDLVTGTTEEPDLVTGITEEPDLVTGITEEPDLVTGITEEPDLVTGTTEEPDLVTGITEEPDLVTGITKEPDLVTGITKEPDLVTGITEEPDLVTGTTEEPDLVTGITEEPDLVTGITKERDLVTGITEEPDLGTGTPTEPDLVTGTTEEPDFVTVTTEEPDLVTGTPTEPDLVTGTQTEPDLVTGTTEEPDLVTGTPTEPDLVTGTPTEPDLVTGTTQEPDLVTGSVPTVEVVTSNINSTGLPTLVTSDAGPSNDTSTPAPPLTPIPTTTSKATPSTTPSTTTPSTTTPSTTTPSTTTPSTTTPSTTTPSTTTPPTTTPSTTTPSTTTPSTTTPSTTTPSTTTPSTTTPSTTTPSTTTPSTTTPSTTTPSTTTPSTTTPSTTTPSTTTPSTTTPSTTTPSTTTPSTTTPSTTTPSTTTPSTTTPPTTTPSTTTPSTTTPSTTTPSTTTPSTTTPSTTTPSTTTTTVPTKSSTTTPVVPTTTTSSRTTPKIATNVWPMFETCPRNITVYTSNDRRDVWWVQPTAKDAQGRKLSNVKPNIAPGFLFDEGVTTVTYSAADDQDRNLQTCRFYVHVVQQEFACLNAPAPRNGRLRCSEVNFIYQCSVMCDSGYLATSSYHGAHLCRTTGWTPPFAAGFNSAACQRHVPVREKNTLTLTFAGSCPGDSATLRESFARSLETLFRTAGLCRAEQNDTVQQQSCDWRNFDVICTSTAAGGRRRKRADNEIKLDILIWFTEDEANTDMHQKVHSREMELQDFIDRNKLHLVVDGEKYSGTGVSALPRAMGCPPGWVQMDNNKGCLECPAGTYHDMSVGECVPCAQGFYQNRASQSSCIMCTVGNGSPEGAISQNQCYYKPIEASTKPPGVVDSNNSIWIVVGICIAGGILLLVAIIVAVVAIHRMCRGKKGEADFENIRVALANGHTGKRPMEDREVAYVTSPDEVVVIEGKDGKSRKFVLRPSSGQGQGQNKGSPVSVARAKQPVQMVAYKRPEPLTVTTLPPVVEGAGTTMTPQYRRLPSGQIVRVVPVRVVASQGRRPGPPRSKVQEMREAARRPAQTLPPGIYRKRQLAAQAPTASSSGSMPQAHHHLARPPPRHQHSPHQSPRQPGPATNHQPPPGGPPGYSGWQSLTLLDKTST